MVADARVWKKAAEEIALPGNEVLDLRRWFEFAWNRSVPAPLNPPPGPQFNLGAGFRQVSWADSLDLEHNFDADNGNHWLKIRSGSVAAIWAHGVFEHLEHIRETLMQCQRVLKPRGVLNIVVPHGLSDLHAEDIDHKHPIVEDTWRNIMRNPYYDAGRSHQWQLQMHTQFIMGVVWRNLALFTQFVKEA